LRAQLLAAQQALQASEAQFRNIIEKNADGILVVDKEGVIRFVNAAAEVLLGRPAAQLRGEYFGYPLVAGHTTEVDILHPHAAPTVAEMRVVESEWEGLPVYLASVRDITAHKALEQRLQTYAQDLERLVNQKVQELESERAKTFHAAKLAALGEMATGIAHELNQPLTAMLFEADYLQLLTSQHIHARSFPAGFDVQELQQMGENLIADIQRCRVIIDHLRDFAQQSLGIPLELDLNQVVERCFLLLEQRLRYNGVITQKRLAAQLPPVMADFTRLEQVILNLITNAEYALEVRAQWQAARESPTTYQKVLEIITYIEDAAVVLEVRDNGCGIPLAAQPHIFEPFFTTKPVGAGVGMGLATSYGIVTEYHGEISFESAENQGTVFRLRFPRT
jgi:C4-dicarboxylate-specific signal transduction histidine kinase